MNRPIGGYFELEKYGKGGNFPQNKGFQLNTGRNAFEYILVSIGIVNKVYVPYYTCEVVLEPLKKFGIVYHYYSVNQYLEIAEDIPVQKDEYILFTNYFGIKDSYIRQLAVKYGRHLIVDCAQALFTVRIDGIKTFYSPRKFVGLPDGGIAFVSKGLNIENYQLDDSSDRMSHLFIRLEKGPQAGYAEFKNNSHKLMMQPIKRMSMKTMSMIESIDFDEIKSIRRRNFYQLHEALQHTNRFQIPRMDSFECPMVYPFWTVDERLRSRLIEEQVFVATYWPNVLEFVQPESLEYSLVTNILPLPIDQRYGKEEMARIIELICK